MDSQPPAKNTRADLREFRGPDRPMRATTCRLPPALRETISERQPTWPPRRRVVGRTATQLGIHRERASRPSGTSPSPVIQLLSEIAIRRRPYPSTQRRHTRSPPRRHHTPGHRKHKNQERGIRSGVHADSARPPRLADEHDSQGGERSSRNKWEDAALAPPSRQLSRRWSSSMASGVPSIHQPSSRPAPFRRVTETCLVGCQSGNGSRFHERPTPSSSEVEPRLSGHRVRNVPFRAVCWRGGG